MEKLWNFNRTLDEIVFEGRNKLYGAFELRIHYSKRMSRAMLMSILFFLLLVSSPLIIEMVLGRRPAIVQVVMGDPIYLPPVPNIEPPKIKSAAQPIIEPPREDVVKNVQPTVVDEDSEVPESPLPSQDDLAGKDTGNENQARTEDGIIDTPVDNNTSGSSSGDAEPAVDIPMSFAQEMPQFPGGEEALYEYISKNVKYLSIARDNRISGSIIVQFVVSKTGEILHAKIVRGLGGGLNEQVLQAVNKMPLWKPGKHNGKTVSVTFTLPVTFKLM